MPGADRITRGRTREIHEGCGIGPDDKVMAGGLDWSWAFVVFRPIPGYEGYMAGSDGTIWSRRQLQSPGGYRKGFRSILSVKFHRVSGSKATTTGYRVSALRASNGAKKPVTFHSLVATAFYGPCPPGMVCRHFPHRDQQNNRIENLSWATPVQNASDRAVHGTALFGESHPNTRLTRDQIVEIRGLRDQRVTLIEIARRYGVTHHCIKGICRRASWKHVV